MQQIVGTAIDTSKMIQKDIRSATTLDELGDVNTAIQNFIEISGGAYLGEINHQLNSRMDLVSRFKDVTNIQTLMEATRREYPGISFSNFVVFDRDPIYKTEFKEASEFISTIFFQFFFALCFKSLPFNDPMEIYCTSKDDINLWICNIALDSGCIQALKNADGTLNNDIISFIKGTITSILTTDFILNILEEPDNHTLVVNDIVLDLDSYLNVTDGNGKISPSKLLTHLLLSFSNESVEQSITEIRDDGVHYVFRVAIDKVTPPINALIERIEIARQKHIVAVLYAFEYELSREKEEFTNDRLMAILEGSSEAYIEHLTEYENEIEQANIINIIYKECVNRGLIKK